MSSPWPRRCQPREVAQDEQPTPQQVAIDHLRAALAATNRVEMEVEIGAAIEKLRAEAK